MAKTVEVTGALTVQADAGVSGSGQTIRQLALGTGSTWQRTYDAVVTTQDEIATLGGVTGGVFQDLSCLDQLSEVQMLYIKSDNSIVIRLYAVPASAVASAGVYPTTFGGGEIMTVTIDGVAVVVTFDVADQTVAQVVARVNAAMALAGIATPRASAVAGQLRIDGVSTAVGASGIGQLSFAGAAAVQLGMDAGSSPTIADAQGQDSTLAGLTLMEFPSSGSVAPTAAQVSGTATIDVVAAGRA